MVTGQNGHILTVKVSSLRLAYQAANYSPRLAVANDTPR